MSIDFLEQIQFIAYDPSRQNVGNATEGFMEFPVNLKEPTIQSVG